jgi:hypothetical protein
MRDETDLALQERMLNEEIKRLEELLREEEDRKQDTEGVVSTFRDTKLIMIHYFRSEEGQI